MAQLWLEGKELGPQRCRGFYANQNSELEFPASQGNMAWNRRERDLHERPCNHSLPSSSLSAMRKGNVSHESWEPEAAACPSFATYTLALFSAQLGDHLLGILFFSFSLRKKLSLQRAKPALKRANRHNKNQSQHLSAQTSASKEVQVSCVVSNASV